jgi:hypothetical protein
MRGEPEYDVPAGLKDGLLTVLHLRPNIFSKQKFITGKKQVVPNM